MPLVRRKDDGKGNQESLDSMLKRFKRQVNDSLIMNELKKREYYLTKSQKRRKKREEAAQKRRRQARMQTRYYRSSEDV